MRKFTYLKIKQHTSEKYICQGKNKNKNYKVLWMVMKVQHIKIIRFDSRIDENLVGSTN